MRWTVKAWRMKRFGKEDEIINDLELEEVIFWVKLLGEKGFEIITMTRN